MDEKITIREFDAARYLDNEELMAGYLSACLEDPNPEVFLAALGDVAKARGITQLAKDSGLGRESLYKTFKAGKKPHFDTILKITKALGVPLSVTTEHPKPPERSQPAARKQSRKPKAARPAPAKRPRSGRLEKVKA